MHAVLRLAHRVLERATDGFEVEAYVEHRVVTTVRAGTGGGARHVGRADTRGVGIRVVVGEHVGYASTADVSEQGLDSAVAAARANARVSQPDPAGAALPLPAEAAPVRGLCLSSLLDMPLAAKQSMATDLARRTTALDPRVRRVDTAQWRDVHRRVAVASTRGLLTAYETAYAELWCDTLGDDHHADATDHAYWWGRDPDEVDIESLASDAVNRTVRLLGPLAPVRQIDTVVLDPEVTGLLLAAAGRGLTGGALANRRSPFANRQGEQVAADLVTLVDDGRHPAAPAGSPYDDEGVPRQRTILIQDGVLSGTLHNTATAASVGNAASTGNARRQNHKASPRAAPSTLRFERGPGPAIDDHGDGLYLRQVSGSVAGISSVTGRVSLGGIGYLVRDGEPAGRLPTVPLATTLQSLLTELVHIGDDEHVVFDQPVLAPTLVWQPRRDLTC